MLTNETRCGLFAILDPLADALRDLVRIRRGLDPVAGANAVVSRLQIHHGALCSFRDVNFRELPPGPFMNDYMVQKFDEHANRVQEEIERCQHLRQLQIEHTGGLFESTSSTGGLFGNRPSSGGLFGPASSTGGLFGNNSSRAMVRNTGGGLFGTTPSTGGLFGDHSSGAMVSNTGGGLFRHSSSFLNDALSQPRVSNAAYERREVTFSANGNATYSQELFRDPPSHFGGGLFGNNGGS